MEILRDDLEPVFLGDIRESSCAPAAKVRILANHSCLTAAQHSHYNVLKKGEIVDKWKIHAGW